MIDVGQNARGEWAWMVMAEDGRVVASGEGLRREEDARTIAVAVRTVYASASRSSRLIEDLEVRG